MLRQLHFTRRFKAIKQGRGSLILINIQRRELWTLLAGISWKYIVEKRIMITGQFYIKAVSSIAQEKLLGQAAFGIQVGISNFKRIRGQMGTFRVKFAQGRRTEGVQQGGSQVV